MDEKQKEKVRKFIEEKKKNYKPRTIKGISYLTGKPFEHTMFDNKEGKKP